MSSADIRLRELKAEHRKSEFFTTFVNWDTGKIETFGPAASPSVRELVQLVLPGSNPELHHTFAVHEDLNTKTICRYSESSSQLWRAQASGVYRVH